MKFNHLLLVLLWIIIRSILNTNRSPFTRKGLNGKSYGELPPPPDTDISFVSSGRPSMDRIFPNFYDNQDTIRSPIRLSNISDLDSNNSFESIQFGRKSLDMINSPTDYSYTSMDSERMSSASQNVVTIQTFLHASLMFFVSNSSILLHKWLGRRGIRNEEAKARAQTNNGNVQHSL